jgi:hypothetical protein
MAGKYRVKGAASPVKAVQKIRSGIEKGYPIAVQPPMLRMHNGGPDFAVDDRFRRF